MARWNLKLSKTFSAIILIIVLSVFVLPQALVYFQTKKLEKEGENVVQAFENQIDDREERVQHSLDELGIVDQGLLTCVTDKAKRLANIHPLSTGGIDSVSEIENLSCSNQEIKDVAGIKTLTGLKNLDLSYNEISDVRPIGNLEGLKTLNLTNNKIEKIIGLTRLDQLDTLYLSGNTISDIENLLDLPSLKTVSLSEVKDTYCADVRAFKDEATFKVDFSLKFSDCKGERPRNYRRLEYQKRSGSELTFEEERSLLEAKINQQKRDYYRKYKEE